MQLIDSWFSDRVLMSALMASAGMHALVLAVRFVDPELLRIRQSDPALEIVLVNAKSGICPEDCGGAADQAGVADEGVRVSWPVEC